MRLRLFRAPRMAEAMAQVRAALGEEAVILATRRVAGGVEVTAALEAAAATELRLIPPDSPEPGPAGPLGRHNLPAPLAGHFERMMARPAVTTCCWSARPAPARR